MKVLRFVAMLLIIVGALNWGLVGFFQYDLVASLFGGMMSMGARVVYGLVGLAGLFGICAFLMRCCCKSSECGSSCKCGPNCNCACKKNQSHHQ
jgi:uncharacterized membrane protein YuzA (DUF378 family)